MPVVNAAPYIKNQYFDDNGTPLDGGLLYTYSAGTETDKDTYSDADGTTKNANPIVLNSAGRCDIFLESGAYDFLLTDSEGNTIWTASGITSSSITNEVDTMADLKALTGGSTAIIRTLGRSSVNDGGGWWYYWDSTSTDTDDGGMVVQPDSEPVAGRWIGFLPSNRELNLRVYGPTLDGETDDTSELQACDAWCNANGCTILIDGNIYVDSDPSLSSRVHLTPSIQFLYGEFNPSLNIIIDEGDSTQHFNCTAIYYPVLSVRHVFPEWFGETISSCPITQAVLDNLDLSGSKIYSGTIKIEDGINIGTEGDTGDKVITINSEGTGRLAFEAYDDGGYCVADLFLGMVGKIYGGGIYWSSPGSDAYRENEEQNAMNVYSTSDGSLMYFGGNHGTDFWFHKSGIVVGSPTSNGGNGGIGYVNAQRLYGDNLIALEVNIINIKSGATQAAAGADTNEIWKTASHATLPDNVLMIGV